MANFLTFSPLPLTPSLPNPNSNPNPKPSHVSFPLSFPAQTLTLTHRRLAPPRAVTAPTFLTAAVSSFSFQNLPSISFEFVRLPMDAVLAAFVRWLGLFREVLLVRVLLTWFPNLPWEKQPFSALRNLTDPCLAIFRDIMPPVMGKRLDLSPILAFYVLEVIISILKTKPVM